MQVRHLVGVGVDVLDLDLFLLARLFDDHNLYDWTETICKEKNNMIFSFETNDKEY